MGSSESKAEDNKYLLEVNEDHEGPINCLAEAEDGSLIATGSDDNTVRIWSTNTEDSECLGIMRGHTNYISCVTFCDIFIISGSADNTIRKWDTTTCECVVKYEGHTSYICRVCCNDSLIFSSSHDKTVRMWPLDAEEMDWDGLPLKIFQGHSKSVIPMIFLPGSSPLISDNKTGKSYSNDILITGSADKTARTWSVDTGNTIKVFKGHWGPIGCMHTDGIYLYTGSTDATIRTWEIQTGQPLKIMEGHTGSITKLLKVDRLMYSGSQDGTARCWVREFGDCTRTYKGHTHSIVALKFLGGILFTGGGDATVRAYDAKSGSLKRIFVGHQGGIVGLSIINKRMFTISSDSTMRVWDISNIGDEPDINIDEESANDFQKKQNQRLEDLDRKMDDYLDI